MSPAFDTQGRNSLTTTSNARLRRRPPREPWIIRLATWAAGATVAAVAVTGGFAKAEEPAPSKRVFIGDLNLQSDAGRAAMKRRVSVAARHVCGAPDRRLTYASRRAAACVRTAVADALAQAAPKMTLARSEP